MLDLTPEILGPYLSAVVPEWASVTVTRLERLPLGASRETYRLDAEVNRADGTPETLQLILRRDPAASLVGTDARTEYESYRAIYGHGGAVSLTRTGLHVMREGL